MTESHISIRLRPQDRGNPLMSKAKTRVEAVAEEAVPDAAQPAPEMEPPELSPVPQAALAPTIDPASPERFVNRELSWLAFNGRVLEETHNPRHPVLERLRFLSISASNLDEFYMVRVAGLSGMVNEGVASLSDDGLSPSEQLVRINACAGKLIADQQRVWTALRGELREVGISVIEPDELDDADKEWLDAQFREQIFPVLTPLAIDPAHPFPFIPNLGFTLALKLLRRRDGKMVMALLPVPAQLQRFIRLPGGAKGKEARFLPLEKVIGLYLGKLFPGYVVTGLGEFRVLRDSDVEIEEEAEDLVLLFESLLKRRRRGSVIHMICSRTMPDDLRQFNADHLKLK